LKKEKRELYLTFNRRLKMKKKYIQITLKKDGYNDIIIKSCPEKIKLNILQTYGEMLFGCPALKVKPIDWKGVFTIYGTFIAPYIACALFVSINTTFAIIALLGLFILNAIITKNYFFNYISKHIKEGYIPETKEQQIILSNAGIYMPLQSDGIINSSLSKQDFAQELEKLANLRDKGIITQEEFDIKKKKLLEQM
jgi:hypothetical protein